MTSAATKVPKSTARTPHLTFSAERSAALLLWSPLSFLLVLSTTLCCGLVCVRFTIKDPFVCQDSSRLVWVMCCCSATLCLVTTRGCASVCDFFRNTLFFRVRKLRDIRFLWVFLLPFGPGLFVSELHSPSDSAEVVRIGHNLREKKRVILVSVESV